MKTLNISTAQFGLVVSAYAFSAAIYGLADVLGYVAVAIFISVFI